MGAAAAVVGGSEEDRTEARRSGNGGGEKVLRVVKRGRERKVRRRVRAEPSPIQRLFMACQDVFKAPPGTVPAPTEVDMLRVLLDKIKAEDFGLSLEIPFFKARSVDNGTPRITYTTIYECDNFSMCIFFLHTGAVIPLHNHPGMTVFSKLLVGSMHTKAYDWVDQVNSDDPTPSTQFRLAKLVVDSVFTAPCDTCILYPTSGGNMHTFRAINPCAILDVMGPPYSKEHDRDCTYYRDHPYLYNPDVATTRGVDPDARYGWLEEIDMEPTMDRVSYLGPKIVDH